jgi:hypothetical protein
MQKGIMSGLGSAVVSTLARWLTFIGSNPTLVRGHIICLITNNWFAVVGILWPAAPNMLQSVYGCEAKIQRSKQFLTKHTYTQDAMLPFCCQSYCPACGRRRHSDASRHRTHCPLGCRARTSQAEGTSSSKHHPVYRVKYSINLLYKHQHAHKKKNLKIKKKKN